jgi:Spy/CpxP family protein refolding chaperone
MKQVSFSGEVLEYQGRKLDTPIKYTGTADQYETTQEAKESGSWPVEDTVRSWINQRKLTSAKAAKYQEVTASLKEAYENSPEFKRKNLVNAMLAAGFSQAEAEALATQKLG